MNYLQRVILKIVALPVAIFLISGCGGSSDKELPNKNSYTLIDGRVVDGEIKDATIFYDINRNGLLDSGEPNCKSDSEGKFELKVEKKLFDNYTIPIVSNGGFDIRANAKYNQTLMAFRQKGSSSVVLTPLSTLVAVDVLDNLESTKALRASNSAIDVDTLFAKLADAQQKFAELFELDYKLLTKDPIELALNGNLKLLETNIKVNKVAREIKKAIKKDLKQKSKDAIRSFRALSKALKEAQKQAKKGDEALAEAIDYIATVEPDAFNKDVIPSVKESTKFVISQFNKSWNESKPQIISALKDKQKEFEELNKDTTPPTITLIGANPIDIEIFSKYSEPGAKAIDNKDGLVEVKIDNSKLKIDTLGS
jgi:hypothetical protein